MDATKIGAFIAERRKLKTLTQQELADRLHLSNRTISKWECGKGIPDSSIMLELCEVLDISVNELLCGENISNEEYRLKADKNILALIDTPLNTNKQNLLSILFSLLTELILVIFITICIYANVMNGTTLYDYIDIPATLIVVGTVAIILVITGLYKDYIRAFKVSFYFCDDILIEEIENCVVSVKIVMLSAFLSGLALSVASLIGTMANTTTANAVALKPAIAVSLLGLLYGVLVCIIMIPLLGRLYKFKYQRRNSNEK